MRQALELRAAVRAAGAENLREFLEAQGHTVIVKALRASAGGLEACVSPIGPGRYRYVCDPDPTPGESPAIGQLADPAGFRIAFRLAHEYAHTVFAPAHGLRAQHLASEVEEARCDLFALAFLFAEEGPDLAVGCLTEMRSELAPFIGEHLVA